MADTYNPDDSIRDEVGDLYELKKDMEKYNKKMKEHRKNIKDLEVKIFEYIERKKIPYLNYQDLKFAIEEKPKSVTRTPEEKESAVKTLLQKGNVNVNELIKSLKPKKVLKNKLVYK